MTTRTIRLAGLLLLFASVANGQNIAQPPRSTSGLLGGPEAVDPSRMRQELSVSFDFLGGYDDNILPPGQTIDTNPFAVRESGVISGLTGGINYRRSNNARGIETSGRTFVNSFRSVGVRPLVGGFANVRGFARFKRTLLAVTGEGNYQPTFMFTTVGSPAADGAAPPVDPTFGVADSRAVSANGAVTAAHEWTGRQRTNAGFTLGSTRLFGLTESTMTHQRLSVGHAWDVSRNVSIGAGYDRSQDEAQDFSGGLAPVDSQSAAVRLELRRPISRTRRMTFSFGGGVMRVETRRASDDAVIDYYAPSGMAVVRMDLGRTWAFSTDVRRDVSMVLGLTEQSFLTTTGTLWLGGNIGSRMALSFATSYMVGSPHEGETGSYTSVNGMTQMQYRLSRCCSLLGTYTYYDHQLRDVSAVPVGFPRTFERNAIRGGVTIWLPLYGTFPR